MKKFASLVAVTSSIFFLSACGSQADSELAGSKVKYNIVCDMRVNQFVNGSLTAQIDVKQVGKKKFDATDKAFQDANELAAVVSATDKECSKNYLKINIAACGQISSNVNIKNLGLYNTFNLNNGLSTGYYQCQVLPVAK